MPQHYSGTRCATPGPPVVFAGAHFAGPVLLRAFLEAGSAGLELGFVRSMRYPSDNVRAAGSVPVTDPSVSKERGPAQRLLLAKVGPRYLNRARALPSWI